MRSLRMWMTLALAFLMAPAALAGEEPVTYKANASIRVLDGQGQVLASYAEALPFQQSLIFTDAAGNHYIRNERQESGLALRAEDRQLTPNARPAGTDYLVLNTQGVLQNLLDLSDGLVLRGQDLPAAGAVRPEDISTDGQAWVVQVRWPTHEGVFIPVTLRVEPGRTGGQGDTAWKEVRFRFSGQTVVTDSELQGLLTLEGQARMVLGLGKPVLAAADYAASARMESEGAVLAKAEASLSLRAESVQFPDLPEFGYAPVRAISPRAEIRYAAARTAWPVGCLGFALVGAAGYVLAGRRGRYRRLERLLVLALVPGLMLLAAPSPGYASTVKDTVIGAASLVTGAVATPFAFQLVMMGGLTFVGAMFGAGAAIPMALTIGGVALIVGAVALMGYGGYKLFRAFKGWRARKSLTSNPSPWDRAQAAQNLARLGDKDNLDVLLKALTDAVPQVRASAVDAIARLGVASAASALDQALAVESDPDVRLAIEKAKRDLAKLGNLGFPGAGATGVSGGGAGGGGGGAWGGTGTSTPASSGSGTAAPASGSGAPGTVTR